jgi:hypothetical protein
VEERDRDEAGTEKGLWNKPWQADICFRVTVILSCERGWVLGTGLDLAENGTKYVSPND